MFTALVRCTLFFDIKLYCKRPPSASRRKVVSSLCGAVAAAESQPSARLTAVSQRLGGGCDRLLSAGAITTSDSRSLQTFAVGEGPAFPQRELPEALCRALIARSPRSTTMKL